MLGWQYGNNLFASLKESSPVFAGWGGIQTCAVSVVRKIKDYPVAVTTWALNLFVEEAAVGASHYHCDLKTKGLCVVFNYTLT